jgi:hypothetical protein
VISRSATARHSQWFRMSGPGSISGSESSRQKRIFAIVSPPIPSQVEGKTIRRIVIFDNHPDSLRLVLGRGTDAGNDDALSRGEKRTAIICGFVLLAMVLAGVFWALCW